MFKGFKEVYVRPNGSMRGVTPDGRRFFSSTTYNEREAQRLARDHPDCLTTGSATIETNNLTGEVQVRPSRSKRLWVPLAGS